jgi:hypothetical protein
VALQEDLLAGTKFNSLLTKSHGVAEPPAEGDDSALNGARFTFDAATLRSCCKNAIAIRAMVLSDEPNYRYVSIFGGPTKIVKDWHTDAVVRMRSSFGCENWLLEQTSGGCMGHISKIFQAPCHTQTLCEAGFAIRYQDAVKLDPGEA